MFPLLILGTYLFVRDGDRNCLTNHSALAQPVRDARARVVNMKLSPMLICAIKLTVRRRESYRKSNYILLKSEKKILMIRLFVIVVATHRS